MNTISQGMSTEAETIFKDHILKDKTIKGVVFISSKSDNFIAGADIDMIKAVKDKSELQGITMKGHALFDMIKATKLPMVAAINGAALGGGLEWAMYCDYRIATTNRKTVLGLPEVKLGLMPGNFFSSNVRYYLFLLLSYHAIIFLNLKPNSTKEWLEHITYLGLSVIKMHLIVY